jgi:tellurite resistance protein TerC
VADVLHVTAVGWTVTVASVAGLFVLDWLILERQAHEWRFGEAAIWSVGYILVGAIFGAVFGLLSGWDFAVQYYAGYVVEKSLSVDNLFVFVIIMSAFAVPVEQQPKALTIGITLALGLRIVVIALGAALLAAFSFMFLVFGLALIITAVQLYRHRDKDPSLQDNAVIAYARRALPFTDRYVDGRLVTRNDGRRIFTPLFLVLLAIGSSDVLFAFDSIPAVYGVTDHAYIVFAANAFALLGLRALFFLVSGLLDRLVYLSTGLALILAFIGIKLVLEFARHQNHSIPEISTGVSLAVVAAILMVITIASMIKVRHQPTLRAHAGSLRDQRRSRPDGAARTPASPTHERSSSR